MGYDTWLIFFLGTMTALLVYNTVQWCLYQERIYGLYSVYLVIWLVYFSLRSVDTLPENTADFIRIVGPMAAYFVYYNFTITFLNLRTYRYGLLRLFRVTQIGLILYTLVEIGFCFFSDYWQSPAHEYLHTGIRTILAILSTYIVLVVYRRKDPIARFFITGSALLVLGALVAMILTLTIPVNRPNLFWYTPLTYLQLGIVFELVFFSAGLAYRHRREILKKAFVTQTLTREREKYRHDLNEVKNGIQLLQQEVDEMHMRTLQAQLSPHFLFNSLNSLSALIADEPTKAEQFVDELASVYRYLLQSSDQELIPLEVEMKFISSYYHLLKTRYGQGIYLDVSINNCHAKSLLPPLTLQLLLENAVKHNIVSVKKPLSIRIFVQSDLTLVVRNNLQRKTANWFTSTQKGLQNINMKYRLLNQPSLSINESESTYDVIVPLIPATEAIPHSADINN